MGQLSNPSPDDTMLIPNANKQQYAVLRQQGLHNKKVKFGSNK